MSREELVDVDLINNNDIDNDFELKKKCLSEDNRLDSGLEVITPKSDCSIYIESFVLDQNGNHSLPTANDIAENLQFSPISLDLTNKLKSNNNIVELKLLNESYIFYPFDDKIRNVKISDFRSKPSLVQRSHTFNTTPSTTKSPSQPFQSLNDLTSFIGISTDSGTDSPNKKLIYNGVYSKKSWIHQFLSCLKKSFCLKKQSVIENIDNFDEFIIDESGCIAFELFEKIEYFNSGGQSLIYKAQYNNQTVVLKTVSKVDNIDLKLMKELDHNNVVKFLGSTKREATEMDQNPKYFIIMEFCDCGRLYNMIQLNDYKILPNLIFEWVQQICSGMIYLHSHRIIHKDLKSLNILIKDGFLKIADFRVEKKYNSHREFGKNQLNSVVGTYPWMAPEAIRGGVITEKVDVWSFGVIIWELLTRKIPYDSVNEYAIILGVPEGSLKLPLPESIPSRVQKFLNLLWSMDPSNRPSFHDIDISLIDHFSELLNINSDSYEKLQTSWADHVEEKYQTMSKSQISISKIQHDLVRKRDAELRDAREIKKLYNDKLKRADKIVKEMLMHTESIRNERKRIDLEWARICEYTEFINQPEIQTKFLKFKNNNKIVADYKCTSLIERCSNIHDHPIKKLNRKRSVPIQNGTIHHKQIDLTSSINDMSISNTTNSITSENSTPQKRSSNIKRTSKRPKSNYTGITNESFGSIDSLKDSRCQKMDISFKDSMTTSNITEDSIEENRAMEESMFNSTSVSIRQDTGRKYNRNSNFPDSINLERIKNESNQVKEEVKIITRHNNNKPMTLFWNHQNNSPIKQPPPHSLTTSKHSETKRSSRTTNESIVWSPDI